MTDADAGRASRTRIGAYIGNERHGERLREWLHSRDDVETVDTFATDRNLDLCIVDPAGMREHATAIAARQREERPRQLPVLLVVPAGKDAVPADLSAFEAEHDLHIDATISAPLREAALSRQVETLVRSGRLSRELSESRERYRALVDLSPEAILVLREGKVRYANDAARTLFDTDTLGGRTFETYVASEHRERFGITVSNADGEFVPLRATTETGEVVECELAAMDVHYGSEPAVQIVVRDVTEQKRNAERLRLYRRAMDDADQGITIADAEADDLPIIYANEAFVRITGYPTEEVIGENCRFLQGPGTEEETVDEIRAALEAERPITTEILNYTRDGRPFWNELHITPIRDESGEVTHYIGLQQNITERKRHFQRLSVLDRVLRHNIRNKTNVIAGYAADIESGAVSDTAEAAATIRGAAEELNSLSEAAREFHAAMDDNEDGTVRDLERLATAVVDDARAEYASDAEIRVEHEGDEPVCALVTPAIRLALEEILGNAVEHSDREQPVINLTVARQGQWAEIAVADDGPGIPEQVLNIIEARTETPTEHLSRLGLWLVRWAVRGAGGDLAFERNDPRGSIVRIRLPWVAPQELPSEDG